MSKIIGLDGKQITNDKLEVVNCIALFDKLEKFTAAPTIPVIMGNRKILMPVKDYMQTCLFNIYTLMQHCKVKDLTLNLNDTTSELGVNKSLRIELGEGVSNINLDDANKDASNKEDI